MTPEQAALLADTRLSREARIMGLCVSGRGEGFHEIAHEEFRVLLGRGSRGLAKDDTLAGYIQELASHHWIERQPGGRGSPRYRFTPPPREGKENALPPLGSSAPPPRGTKETVSPSTMGGQSAPPPPPPVTTPPPVSSTDARARAFVGGRETLVGCRGAMLDYLAEGRVPDPDRQLAWVHSVASMLEGGDEAAWMLDDGSHVPMEDRTAIVAAALNELRQTDEIGKHFRHPPGHIRNLRSKVRYAVRSLAGAKRDAQRRSTQTRGAEGEGRSEEATGGGRARRDRPDFPEDRKSA